jgi:hypothetical protein
LNLPVAGNELLTTSEELRRGLKPSTCYAFFENFIEDIDEFAAVRDIPTPNDFQIVKNVSESAFKQCLVEILGDAAKADWGGETSDHFTSHLHLNLRANLESVGYVVRDSDGNLTLNRAEPPEDG